MSCAANAFEHELQQCRGCSVVLAPFYWVSLHSTVANTATGAPVHEGENQTSNRSQEAQEHEGGGGVPAGSELTAGDLAVEEEVIGALHSIVDAPRKVKDRGQGIKANGYKPGDGIDPDSDQRNKSAEDSPGSGESGVFVRRLRLAEETLQCLLVAGVLLVVVRFVAYVEGVIEFNG